MDVLYLAAENEEREIMHDCVLVNNEFALFRNQLGDVELIPVESTDSDVFEMVDYGMIILSNETLAAIAERLRQMSALEILRIITSHCEAPERIPVRREDVIRTVDQLPKLR
ncbi:hypothetical protein [Paenibacillus vini]|uniref:Uncharacterized protein n=1 Tax=Paenibacillus vini TaxID=1476024 RepID=A0ABQ4MH35_9BACL|nr:hypothetical protein [Paenibacillus vini]GIP55269.1 hypothetical protein J42TS3_43040 [Paenibacillus vini]